MADLAAGSAFLAALEREPEESEPFRRGVPRDVLDPGTLAGLKARPHAAPNAKYDLGRREENDAATIFVPGEDIRRGFRKRPIDRDFASEWRNRHELACLDGSVG